MLDALNNVSNRAQCTQNGQQSCAQCPSGYRLQITNNVGSINSMNNIFINHFLDLGLKNPYGEIDPVVYTARNGTNDRDGRMRFDETECSSGSEKKQIALWVKTHKEYYPILIAGEGWCDEGDGSGDDDPPLVGIAG